MFTPLGGFQSFYPVPANKMPKQEHGKPKRPSGPHPKHHHKHPHHKPPKPHHHKPDNDGDDRGDGDHDADDR